MKEKGNTGAPPSGYAILRMTGWAIIGWLIARRLSSDPNEIIGVAVIGAFSGIILLSPLRWMFYLFNPVIRKSYGYAGIRKAVGTGYLVMLPFCLLALAGELLLGWNVLTVFALAGMMAGSGAAGNEISKLGGKPVLNLIIGVVHGLALAMIWTFLMLVVQANG